MTEYDEWVWVGDGCSDKTRPLTISHWVWGDFFSSRKQEKWDWSDIISITGSENVLLFTMC